MYSRTGKGPHCNSERVFLTSAVVMEEVTRLVSTGDTVKIWDAVSMAPLEQFNPHSISEPVAQACWSSNSILISGCGWIIASLKHNKEFLLLFILICGAFCVHLVFHSWLGSATFPVNRCRFILVCVNFQRQNNPKQFLQTSIWWVRAAVETSWWSPASRRLLFQWWNWLMGWVSAHFCCYLYSCT